MAKFKFDTSDQHVDVITIQSDGITTYMQLTASKHGDTSVVIALDDGAESRIPLGFTHTEARQLAGILLYFADIGELPPNFEALQD
jgi:hypothetical protein